MITLAVLLAGGFLLYTGWWFWLAGEVRASVDDWVAGMRADGRETAYASLDVSGFPGPLLIRIGEIDVTDTRGGWQLHAPALMAEMAPWNITVLSGAFSGPVAFRADKGAAPGRYTIAARANAFNVDRESGGRLRLNLAGVRMARDGQDGAVQIETAALSLIRDSIPVYGRLHLDVRDVRLPPELYSAFGGEMPHLTLSADATGAVIPEGISAASLRTWTDNGGALDIRVLDIAHGVLGLKGEGTLALDGDLQPIGAFTARISGFNDAVDTLVAGGAVRREDGALAKVVLGVLAKTPAAGGPKQVALPLTLQDRQLSVGPIPLLRVRRIDWE